MRPIHAVLCPRRKFIPCPNVQGDSLHEPEILWNTEHFSNQSVPDTVRIRNLTALTIRVSMQVRDVGLLLQKKKIPHTLRLKNLAVSLAYS